MIKININNGFATLEKGFDISAPEKINYPLLYNTINSYLNQPVNNPIEPQGEQSLSNLSGIVAGIDHAINLCGLAFENDLEIDNKPGIGSLYFRLQTYRERIVNDARILTGGRQHPSEMQPNYLTDRAIKPRLDNKIKEYLTQ